MGGPWLSFVWIRLRSEFFVDLCVYMCVCVSPPQDKATLPNPHRGCTRRQGEELSPRRGFPAVCKCRHLPGGAPLPLWAAAGLPVWPPEGVRSKWAGNSVFTYQGPDPSLQDGMGGVKGTPGASRSRLVFRDDGKQSQLGADVPALWS